MGAKGFLKEMPQEDGFWTDFLCFIFDDFDEEFFKKIFGEFEDFLFSKDFLLTAKGFSMLILVLSIQFLYCYPTQETSIKNCSWVAKEMLNNF